MSDRFERRFFLHAFLGRVYFYVPVLVHHLVSSLAEAGISQTHAFAMSTLALFSIGITLAEYPSGVFADWVGRRHSLILGALLQTAGVLLFLVSGSIAAIFAAQIALGVAAAFRSGADSAMLHAHLDDIGESHRYGASLARLRFWNLAGLVPAAATGGLLYELNPSLVFVLSAAGSLLSIVPLLRLEERRPESTHARYFGLVRASLAELRDDRRARALVVLGGAGGAYFIFGFWATQSYMVEAGVPPVWMGFAGATISLLQASTMPLSAWLGVRLDRQSRAFPLLVAVSPTAFLAAGAAAWSGRLSLGLVPLVAAAACTVLYRNAVNVRLQALVSDRVRASVVSLEAWVGAVWYVIFFPIGGWLIDSAGLDLGFAGIAAIVAATFVPWLLVARRRGVWTQAASSAATCSIT